MQLQLKFELIWFKKKQRWTIEEISIFSNSSHLEWSAMLSDQIRHILIKDHN
jgi:hypothetical protein